MWKNATSYGRGEGRSNISTTTMEFKLFKITVTKYVGYGDELVMHCYELGIKQRALNVSDMKEGQRRAIQIVKKVVDSMHSDLNSLNKGE